MMINEILKEQWMPVMKKTKAIAIIASLLMILLGALMILNPFGGMKISAWFLIASLLLYGILHLIMYFKLPPFLKNVTDLYLGILWMVIGVLLVFGAVLTDAATQQMLLEKFSEILGVMLGIICCLNAIRAFWTGIEWRKMGYSAGGSFLGGVLLALGGILMIINPLSTVMTLVVFWGIFSMIIGVSTFCRALSF